MPDRTFTAEEIRVIGSLIEKSLTTPDQYPLSLNALQNACNQRSNRDPVLDLDDSQVQSALDSLCAQGIVTAQSGFGSRVEKYKHRFCNTEFSEWQFTARELGILCVLFLRGPQTPGELRSRTNRLCTFDSLEAVEATLDALAGNSKGPFVQKLERDPGKREARYRHLFTSDDAAEDSTEPADEPFTQSAAIKNNDTSESLEARVARLENQVEQLLGIVSQLEQNQ